MNNEITPKPNRGRVRTRGSRMKEIEINRAELIDVASRVAQGLLAQDIAPAVNNGGESRRYQTPNVMNAEIAEESVSLAVAILRRVDTELESGS